MRAVDLIAAKRDGKRHSATQIAWLVDGLLSGAVPAEQAAAWLMAVVWRGLDDEETTALCDAMVGSGQVLDFDRRVVDKHSTGGVGDKVTIALVPLVASCGIAIAKMSGRGLGHTGGTLDKLAAIPGMQTRLDVATYRRLVDQVGCVVAAQTASLVPADGALYALRDATATVQERGLIAASVMAKKIAGGASAILIDVKCGVGGFCRTRRQARQLAQACLMLGGRAGRSVVCDITAMDAPLGCAVGNALEVAEAMAFLHEGGPPDLDATVRRSAVTLLRMAEPALTAPDASMRVSTALSTGAAAAKAEEWIAAQGGDARVVTEPWRVLARAPLIVAVHAPRSGYISRINALSVGLASVTLGAGRVRRDDDVDPRVGVALRRRIGDAVTTGDVIAECHAATAPDAAAAARTVLGAYRIGDAPPPARPLLLETLPARKSPARRRAARHA